MLCTTICHQHQCHIDLTNVSTDSRTKCCVSTSDSVREVRSHLVTLKFFSEHLFQNTYSVTYNVDVHETLVDCSGT